MLNSDAQHPHDVPHSRFTAPTVAVVIALFLLWFLSTGVSQAVAAALFIGVGLVLVVFRPTAAAAATLVFLLLLGDIRRFVSMHTGLISQDPLLLVGPAIVSLLFTRLMFERRITADTLLSKLVVAMMILMGLEIFNPLQGGLTVGVAGGLFYLVPLLWFWAGRSLPTERMAATLLKVVFPLMAVVAAALGLYQTFYGYLSFEAEWVRQQIANGFNAMIIDGSVVRSFSFFTSPAEYALFLAMVLVCCAAPLLVWRFKAVTLLIPLIVWAMFLASVRSAIVLSALGIMAMWSIGGRDARQIAVRAFLAVVIGGGVMYFGLHRLQGEIGGSGQTTTLLDHTVGGLLNPGESSAGGHWALVKYGIAAGLKNPIGNGLGSTTMAASKFSTGGGSGYENDIANMFAALGVFGGVMYVAIIGLVLYHTFVIWRDRRSFGALMIFGVLLSQFGYWLEGSHYGLAAIVWFLIGSIDRCRPLAEQPGLAREVPAWEPEPVAVANAPDSEAEAVPRREPRRAPGGAPGRRPGSWRPQAVPGRVGGGDVP